MALPIDRVQTALQLPVPPFLEPDTLPWASVAAGRAVALGGPHTSLGDTQAPSTSVGYKGPGQGCPRVLGRQQGWQVWPAGREGLGTIPWDSPGAGRACGTQGHFACVTALHPGAAVPQFGEHYRLQDTSGSQQGPKPGRDGPLQPPNPHNLVSWDRLRPGLDPVPPPARVCPGRGECGQCCPSCCRPEVTVAPGTPCVAGQGPR